MTKLSCLLLTQGKTADCIWKETISKLKFESSILIQSYPLWRIYILTDLNFV